MGRIVGKQLPDVLIHRLRHAGSRPVTVATVDEQGRPNSAPISWIVARDARTLRIAVTHNTETLCNLRQNGHVCITVLGSGIAMTVTGRGKVVKETMESVPFPTAIIEIDVEGVKDDGELRTGPSESDDVAWSKRRASMSDARVQSELLEEGGLEQHVQSKSA